MRPVDEREGDTVAPPAPHPQLKYARIVLKLSGEALCGRDGGFGIDGDVMRATAAELAEVHALGAQIGIVVGGGNIFRGLKGASTGMHEAWELRDGDKVVYIAKRTCLRSVAIDRDVASKQRLHNEIRNDASIVGMHAWSISIEDAGNFDLQLSLLPISKKQTLRAALPFVITGAQTDRVHMAPIFFRLRMHARVAVDL